MKETGCSDSNILKLLRSGNESDDDRALNCLYEICYKQIVRFVVSNNGSEDEAKDILQDAIIVFYEQCKSKDLILGCSINTYIYSVCRNLWLKRLKHKGRFLNDVSEYIAIDEDLSDESDNDLINREFIKVFDLLGKSCKDILTYYYYDKYSMKEIMSKMNFKSEQTAKNKKYKCLNYLRDVVLKNKIYKDYFEK